MSFFKKLFKRKKGGTFIGNLIRGVANKATGGILGNGVGLAKWEAKQEKKEYNKAVQDEVNKRLKQSQAYNQGVNYGGQAMGQLTPMTQPYVGGLAPKSYTNETAATTTSAKDWLKKNWLMIAAPLVAIVTLVLYVTKNKPKKYR